MRKTLLCRDIMMYLSSANNKQDHAPKQLNRDGSFQSNDYFTTNNAVLLISYYIRACYINTPRNDNQD